MSVEIRRRGTYLQHDIITRGPDGREIRERRKCPVQSKTGAQRWAEARERHLAQHGPDEASEAPTLKEFGPRWVKEYGKANRNKPSTLAAKETILRLHLYPVIGGVRLDQLGAAEVQKVKAALAGKSPKTEACVLAVLATLLRTAEEWHEIARAPRIKMPKVPKAEMDFYDFGEWERLVAGAAKAGPMVLAFVLLGGEAGLRRGELVALERGDVGGGEVVVRRNEWEGEVGTPKGGNLRRVPMTARLAAALEAVRHLRGARLLWQANGRPVKVPTLQSWLEVATKRAGLPESRDIHKLRHTFCSHLAMRGASPKAIQELAGHADLATTMRYMHLSPAAKESAIRLLEPGAVNTQEARR